MVKSTVWMAVLAAGLLAGSVRAEGFKTSLSLGVTATDGNSDTLGVNVGVLTERKTDVDAWRFGVDGQYGEVSGSTTTEQAKASAGYRHTISGRAYGLLDVSLAYDAIADIDYRLIVSPGLGYYLLKDAANTLGLELGPSYIKEKVGGEETDYAALRAAERFDRTLSESAKCWEAVEYLPSVDDLQDDYLLNAEAGVEAQINATASIRLVVKDVYDSTPAAGREKNDLSVVAALAYTL